MAIPFQNARSHLHRGIDTLINELAQRAQYDTAKPAGEAAFLHTDRHENSIFDAAIGKAMADAAATGIVNEVYAPPPAAFPEHGSEPRAEAGAIWLNGVTREDNEAAYQQRFRVGWIDKVATAGEGRMSRIRYTIPNYRGTPYPHTAEYLVDHPAEEVHRLITDARGMSLADWPKDRGEFLAKTEAGYERRAPLEIDREKFLGRHYKRFNEFNISEESLQQSAKAHGAEHLGEITGDKAQKKFREIFEKGTTKPEAMVTTTDATPLCPTCGVGPSQPHARACPVGRTTKPVDDPQAFDPAPSPSSLDDLGRALAVIAGAVGKAASAKKLEEIAGQLKTINDAQAMLWAGHEGAGEQLEAVCNKIEDRIGKVDGQASAIYGQLGVVLERLGMYALADKTTLATMAEQLATIYENGAAGLARETIAATEERYHSLERAVHEMGIIVRTIRVDQEKGATEPDPALKIVTQTMAADQAAVMERIGALEPRMARMSDCLETFHGILTSLVTVQDQQATRVQTCIDKIGLFATAFEQQTRGVLAMAETHQALAAKIDSLDKQSGIDRDVILNAIKACNAKIGDLQPKPEFAPFVTEEEAKSLAKNAVEIEQAAIWEFSRKLPVREKTKLRDFLLSRSNGTPTTEETPTNG